MKLFVRLAAFIGGSILYIAVNRLFPTEDANIGAGLIYFGLIAVASLGWGLWDGRHDASFGAAAVRWGIVGVVIGLLDPVRIWLTEGFDTSVLLSDLAEVTPFMAALVIVPALVGIAVGKTFGGRGVTAGSANS